MMRFLILVPALALAACGASTTLASTPAVIPDAGVITNLGDATATTPEATVVIPNIVVSPVTPVVVENTSFASLMNGVRMTAGAGDIAFDTRIGAAAQNYADEMLADGRFDHEGADGSTVGSRATDAGYNCTTIAENIAMGQETQADAFTSWQNSAGHRANNLNPAMEDFGLGLGLGVAGSGSERRWVLVLGAE
jgi:uncharacterized protein YkwD